MFYTFFTLIFLHFEAFRYSKRSSIFRFSDPTNPDPDSTVILDLQTVKYGRPGIELAYFLGSSTSPDQRNTHLSEFLR
jgi:hypothetical protein